MGRGNAEDGNIDALFEEVEHRLYWSRNLGEDLDCLISSANQPPAREEEAINHLRSKRLVNAAQALIREGLKTRHEVSNHHAVQSLLQLSLADPAFTLEMYNYVRDHRPELLTETTEVISNLILYANDDAAKQILVENLNPLSPHFAETLVAVARHLPELANDHAEFKKFLIGIHKNPKETPWYSELASRNDQRSGTGWRTENAYSKTERDLERILDDARRACTERIDASDPDTVIQVLEEQSSTMLKTQENDSYAKNRTQTRELLRVLSYGPKRTLRAVLNEIYKPRGRLAAVRELLNVEQTFIQHTSLIEDFEEMMEPYLSEEQKEDVAMAQSQLQSMREHQQRRELETGRKCQTVEELLAIRNHWYRKNRGCYLKGKAARLLIPRGERKELLVWNLVQHNRSLFEKHISLQELAKDYISNRKNEDQLAVHMDAASIFTHRQADPRQLEVLMNRGASTEELKELSRITIDGYTPLQRLGDGAWGQVYLVAKDGVDDFTNYRALKIIKPQTERVEKTIDALGGLEAAISAIEKRESNNNDRLTNNSRDEPGRANPVPVFKSRQTVTIDGEEYQGLIFEYVEGEKLSEQRPDGHYIAGKPAEEVDLSERIKLLPEAAKGIDYIHDHNMVHNDVKGENMMITPSGRIYVTDLGISQLEGEIGLKGSPATQESVLLDGGTATRSCDIYSFGNLIHAMLTGKRLIEYEPGETQSELYTRRKEERLRAIDNIDLPTSNNPTEQAAYELAEDIIARCVHPNKEERYASMREVENDLQALSESMGER